MAIEFVWAALLREAINGANQLAHHKIDNWLINKNREEQQNAWFQNGYQDGVVDTAHEYSSRLRILKEAAENILKEHEAMQRTIEYLTEEKKIYQRAAILADCQRCGYIEAIGMLKATIDYKNNKVRDLDGNLITASVYIDEDGSPVPIYDKKTGTRLDYEGINDVLHPDGSISIYEECFANGFKNRAAYLLEEARANRDFAAINALNNSVSTFVKNTFKQSPIDARMFKKLEGLGRDYMNGKVIPHWKQHMQEVMEFFKEKGLTQKELDGLIKTKRDEVISLQAFTFDEEKEEFRKRGVDIEAFV